MKCRKSIFIVIALLFPLTMNSSLRAADDDILIFLPAIISNKAIKKGYWVGDGLSFIVTNSHNIEDFEYNYEGFSKCQNCKFTIANISINRRKFRLSNRTISFLLNGSFSDKSHMSAQVTMISKEGACSLSSLTVLAEKAGVGTVVKSFDSPGNSPTGLTFDGKFLWNADHDDDKIYKLDTDGNVISSFDSPGDAPRGLAFDGTFLWNAGIITIYKLDTHGNIISSFDSPGNSPFGLAFDGKFLWNADHNDAKIYRIDTHGNIISSFDSPGKAPRGLAFDGTYLWNADAIDDKIYKLDTDGNIISSFDSPGSTPIGLAFNGIFLWNANFTDSKEIYKIDILD